MGSHGFSPKAMASVADSKAAFKAHLVDLEIDSFEPAFVSNGIPTYGDLGFAVSDAQFATAIETELVKPICGD